MNFQGFVELIVAAIDDVQNLKKTEALLAAIVEQNPEFFYTSAIQCLKIPNFDAKYKVMASILLRQKSTVVNNVMGKLNPQQFEAARREIIVILQSENDKTLLKSYTDLVLTMTGTILTENGTWNELFNFFGEVWAKSQLEIHRLLSAEFFSGIIQSPQFQQQNLQKMADIFRSYLCDQSMEVRLSALGGLLYFKDDEFFRKNFQPLLPNIIAIITSNLEDDEDLARTAISKLNDIISDFIAPQLDNFVAVMFEILKNENYDPETKHAAAEFLASVCESMTPTIRKNTPFLNQFIPHLIIMLADIEENPKWVLGEKYDNEDETSEVAKGIIDRISFSLRGNTLAPILFNFIVQSLSNEDWKFRHAALFAISSMGEGCKKFLSNHLDKVLDFIIPRLADPHERVRWTACNALGQMCTDFSPNIQYNYHQRIIPPIINTMNDPCSRVQAHAVAVIVNFCGEADSSVMAPYLNHLLEKLSQLLSHSDLLVIENTIFSISSIAESVKELFTPYYSLFMSTLQPIMKQAQTNEFKKIGGLVFEAMSSIATAVGRDVFLPSAPALIEAMFFVKANIKEADDPRIESINSSLVNIAIVLKDKFVPYFGQILPELLQSVTLDSKPEYCDLDTMENKDDYHYSQSIGSNAVGINTSLIQEKITACTNLSIYIDQMGAAFFPWIDQILPICKDIVSFEASGDVKVCGASIAAATLQSAHAYFENSEDKSNLISIFQYIFPYLYDTIKAEDEPEFLNTHLLALTETITAGSVGLNDEIVGDIKNIIKMSLELFAQHNQEYEEACNSPDFDPEDKEALDNDMEFVLGVLVYTTDIIGKMLEFVGDSFLSFIQTIIPFYFKFLLPSESRGKCKLSAICLYDDVIRFGKENGKELCGSWLPNIIEFAGGQDITLAQSATYGVGVSAEFMGEGFAPYLQKSVGVLMYVINNLNRTKRKEAKTIENSIAALGKILQFHSNAIDPKLIPFWLSTLPVSVDELECVTIYAQLCCFIIKYPEIMFGENLANLPKILAMFGDVIGSSLISAETSASIKDILTRLQSQIPAEILQQVFLKLEESQISKIRALVSQ